MTSEEYISERNARAQQLLNIKNMEKRRQQAYKLAREFDERLINHQSLITNNCYQICLKCELTEKKWLLL